MAGRRRTAPVYELLVRKADGSKVDIGEAIMNAGSSIATLDEAHAEIHRGMMYAGGKVSTNLASGAFFYFIGQNNNSNNMDIHLTAAFAASGDVIVRTIGVTGRIGGASVNSFNRKTATLDSGVDAWWGCTPQDSSPIVVKEAFIPGGSGPLALGGQSVLRAERIVSVGNWIGLEIENVSGGTIDDLGVEWDFYLADPS